MQRARTLEWLRGSLTGPEAAVAAAAAGEGRSSADEVLLAFLLAVIGTI